MAAAAPARVRTGSPARRSHAPVRRDLRVVRAVPRRRRRRLAVTVAVAVSLVAVFGVVGFNTFLVQSQFQLEQIEKQLTAEREEFEQLRLETARLSSPERILSISRVELGMVDPEIVTHVNAPTQDAPSEDDQSTRAWAEVKPFLSSEP